ncbi:hypothetical protein ACFO5R_03875 [Halosolutus amylolyticus]|uniref:DUF7979 domain-containing protein n=1 Tax=Halosolutus amylolyticus TaxID=2932267 RepID=A0ABD5PKI5_9EURY|nr:hypothetical protein [Halosolutus amylolyticus]
MNRRSILAGVAFSSVVAGCTADQSSTPTCHLMHEVVGASDDYGDPIETYRYETLSDDARQAFDRALADGSYATTDQHLDPPEFRYWDTSTVYAVHFRSETHVLLTYTGAGCDDE